MWLKLVIIIVIVIAGWFYCGNFLKKYCYCDCNYFKKKLIEQLCNYDQNKASYLSLTKMISRV